ncbi:SDR family NAD(P)-dependent oxidoreductase [Antrihabitans spumae]|uniref:SDR family NAD(P)-dependent oxidoreductase n=1 Tax=Antrihabitans spumae TaxID=3373370 RepID=A0ABW7KES4_9NOCA
MTPEFVAGHSIGEIAAAHVAGVLSLADAARLVAARGKLMAALPGGGAMVAVQASEAQVRSALVAGTEIAAVNGPTSVVVSGAADPVAALVDVLEQSGYRCSRLPVSHAFHSALVEPMLAEFAQVAESISYTTPSIPMISTVAADLDLATAEYWVRQVREPVGFADAIRSLDEAGVVRFVVLGPDGGLTNLLHESISIDDVCAVPLLRKDRGGVVSTITAAATLAFSGIAVTWRAMLGGKGATYVPLPPYAFAPVRYWASAGAAAVDAAGLRATGHPLVNAIVANPDSGGVVVTGVLSPMAQPWLADHRIGNSIVVAGTVFVELAVRAGDEVGCRSIRELSITAPMRLSADGAAVVHVIVGGADESGTRTVSIYARDETVSAGSSVDEWTLHASGMLSPEIDTPAVDLAAWPPPGCDAVELGDLYGRLATSGYHYGSAFRGLTALWRRGDELFVEAALPDSTDASGFGLHPALLDSILHAQLAMRSADGVLLPFVWEGVTLQASGATAVRARITVTAPDTMALVVVDSQGRPVLSVAEVTARAIAVDDNESDTSSLLRVEWQPVHCPPASVSYAEWSAVVDSAVAVVPADVVVDVRTAHAQTDVVANVHTTSQTVVAVLQRFLQDPRFDASTLTVLTRGGVTVHEDDPVDLGAGAVWGLVRSVQAEEPDRVRLVDTDGAHTDTAEILAATAESTEPQLALRGAEVFVPRLVRGGPTLTAPLELSAGTVLITGGTGGLGAILARHLLRRHGVRHLLLVSRRGASTPGVERLRAELVEQGAAVRVVACDVADLGAVRELVASIDADVPLVGVVHAAGVVDDGVLGTLDPDRLRRVLRPKVDGAWHLHTTTADHDLSMFALFSSAAGVVGSPAQANYAAANAFLDALARQRHAAGSVATSIAWGPWRADGGMTAVLSDTDTARLGRAGLTPLPTEDALTLFDEAIRSLRPDVVAATVDSRTLRHVPGWVHRCGVSLRRSRARRRTLSDDRILSSIEWRISLHKNSFQWCSTLCARR